MKRKCGNAKSKSSKRPVVGSDEAVLSSPNGMVQSGLGDFDYANFDSGMEIETPRAAANVSDWQPDGGIIMKTSSDIGIPSDGQKSNASLLQLHGERIQKGNPKVLHQDPQKREQELKAALSVIKKIMKMDAAEPFSIPVDPIALGIPDYFEVIDTPMDFGTICNNLKKGLKYMNSEDVYKDVQYIWENCCTYNKKGDCILELMDGVRKIFTAYWTAAGLYTEPTEVDDGYANLLPPSESSMRCSTRRQGCPVDPVTDKVGPSAVDPCTPGSLFNQPQLSSSQQQPSFLHQDMNAVAGTTGKEYPPLMPPTLSNLRGSEHEKACPVAPAANKPIHQRQDEVSTNQAQVYQSPLIYTEAFEPVLSSNHQQPSTQHESTNTQKRHGRGPARCLKLLTTVGRINVAVNELGEPIGD